MTSRFLLSSSARVWLTMMLFTGMFVIFGLYVYWEQQVDRANERRMLSYQLAQEMRQSSDDLTRMARGYVVAGEPRYKQYFQDILDIRNGAKPRPEDYAYSYWDMVLANVIPPPAAGAQGVALLDLMRQSGFTDEELSMLAEAKANSDELTIIENEAMKLVESGGGRIASQRLKANKMLRDEKYNQAKARVMLPINRFFHHMDERTLQAVQQMENYAVAFRLMAALVALAAVLSLLSSYRYLRIALGGGADAIRAQLDRIGCGDFSDTIAVPPGAENSVLAGLLEMQGKLRELESGRNLAINKQREDAVRIAAILDNVLDGIITINELGVVESFNKSAEKIFGYAASEVIGNNVNMLMSVPYRSELDDYLHNFVSTDKQEIIGGGREVEGLRKDGTVFPMDLAVSEMRLGERRLFIGVVRDITERNKAIQARQADEARLVEAQRIAKMGNWELDMVSGALVWSDEVFRLFEIDKNRFAATYEAFLNAIHPDDREAVNRAYSDSLVSRAPYEITHRLLMPDGRIKWVQERCTSDFDGEGKPLRSRGTVQDVTERKVAEDALRQTKLLLDSIIEHIPTMVFLKRADDLRFELFNRAGEQILGYRREDLLGKNDYDFFPKEQADFFTAADRNVLASREILEIAEEPVTTAAGETRILQTWKIALRDDRGVPNHLLGVSMDITDRKSNEVRLAAILDNILDGVITINDRGIIETFNKSAEKIFGYAASEVTGRNIKMLMPEPYHSQHDGYLGNFAATGVKKIIGIGRQVVGKRRDGSIFPMDLSVSEMRLGEKRMFIGVVRDITERVKIERMKSEFISTVSHELRTPLTSIRGSLGLVAGGVAGELPPKIRSLVEIAHKNSERLILLVNDILDMEKIEAGKMEFDMHPVRVMPLLKHALDSNRAYAEQHKVSYVIESELPEAVINVDENRLQQVFANLLSNAAKFSPAGGAVAIAVGYRGSHIHIAVTDNGIGIPDEFKDKLFQKFVQADSSDTRKKGGTGLGLSIAKGMVEHMGGSIGFESQPNVRTTFYIEFPEWHEVAPPQPGMASEGERADARARVLYVEDDADVFQVVAGIAGALVNMEQATSLADARGKLAQRLYDLVILDLSLPDGSGMELLPQLKRIRPRVPVLVFSIDELKQEDVQRVDAALVKSRTDNAMLLAKIAQLLGPEKIGPDAGRLQE